MSLSSFDIPVLTKPAPAVEVPRMPAIAVWAYVFSFLFSPLGLTLSVLTLKKYRDHTRARRLAYFSIFVGLCYLALFALIRRSYYS